jgi:uncharacterized protein YraI
MCRSPRLLSFLLLLAAPLVGQQVPSADTVATTKAAVTVRGRALATAPSLGTLPARTQVRLNGCADGWCRVATPLLAGYVPEDSLVRSAAVSAQGRGYVNSQGQRIASPTRTPDNQPPAGASAQCRDGTYSFSANRRGTCSHHGGVARWL